MYNQIREKEDIGNAQFDQNLDGATKDSDSTFKQKTTDAYQIRGKFKFGKKVYEYEAIVDHTDTGVPTDISDIQIFEPMENTPEPAEVTDKFSDKDLQRIIKFVLQQAQEDPNLQLEPDEHDGNVGYSFSNPYYKNPNYSNPSGNKYINK